MKVAVRVEGMEEVNRALREFADGIDETLVIESLSAGGEVVAEAMRTTAPVRDTNLQRRPPPGVLKRSIAVSPRTTRRQQRVNPKQSQHEVNAGPAWNLRGFHAHLVEFGTGERISKRTGKSTGVMPPRPFARPAWLSSKMAALDAVVAALRVRVLALAQRVRQ